MSEPSQTIDTASQDVSPGRTSSDAAADATAIEPALESQKVGVVLDAEPVRKHPRWVTALERYGLVLLFGLTVLFFAVYSGSSEYFLTAANVQNVLGNQCITITLAIASLLPLVCGRFDLSVGANAGLCSVATAAAMGNYELGLSVAVVAGLVTGLVVGVVNGALVAYLKLSSIIVTLATTTIISGVILAYAEGQIINVGISQTLLDFGALTWFSLPRVVFLAALICLVAWYLLGHTAFGRHLSMAGRNQAAARLIGINVDRLTFLSFVLGGVLAGVAGVLMTARTGGANPQSGPDFLFPALTAVFLGATSIRPGEFNVVGTIIGALFLATAVSGMTIAGLPTYTEPLFNGAALLVAVVIYRFSRRSASAGGALAM
jgi:ribose transport system permease protein